ncbi:MAG: hypothetical protein GYA15_00135 [Leptolinea sp.]|jgi:hypothetical protein|nr:hypothetical protein [Leptolinea sp.]
MAKISSDNLTLEIRIIEKDERGWIQYEIAFLHNGQPIINDSKLKTGDDGPYWENRPYGKIKANEYEDDKFIPVLERALNTDKEQFCWTVEPNFHLAILPYSFFTLFSGDDELLCRSNELIQAENDRELIREIANNRLSDDVFTIIGLMDSYNFHGEDGYSFNGPALIISTTRYKLLQFIEELKREYNDIG